MIYLIYDGSGASINTASAYERMLKNSPEVEDYTYVFESVREAEDFLETDGFEGGIAFSPDVAKLIEGEK